MKYINHHNAPQTPAHYSAAVRDGNTLDPVTREHCQGGVREQTLQALKNLEALVLQEGGSRNDILRTTAYISDMNNWGAVNDVYREFFGEHKPARTIAAVPEIHFGFLVEIDGIAAIHE